MSFICEICGKAAASFRTPCIHKSRTHSNRPLRQRIEQQFHKEYTNELTCGQNEEEQEQHHDADENYTTESAHDTTNQSHAESVTD